MVGVQGTQYDGTPVTAHATKGVILATGGYAANIQKVVDTNVYWSSEDVYKRQEQHLPLGGVLEAADDAQHGGLAAPRRAQQRDEFALSDI